MNYGDVAFAVVTDRGLLAHVARFQRGEPLSIHAHEQSLGPLTIPLFVFVLEDATGWFKIVRHLPLRDIQRVCRMVREPESHPRFQQLLRPQLKLEAVVQGRMDLLLWLDTSEDPMAGPWTADLLSKACCNHRIDVAQWLIEAHPECCTEDLVAGLARIAQGGHLALLRQLVQKFPEALSPAVFNAALGASHWEVIWFLHQDTICQCTSAAMDEAAARGDMAVVKFLHGHRTEGCTTRAIDHAAKRGDLEMVRFLYENRTEGWTQDAMTSAIAHGHLPIVEFLHEHRPNRPEQNHRHYTMWLRRALVHDKLPIFKYLFEHCNAQPDASIDYQTAASKGIEFFRYLYEVVRIPLPDTALHIAVNYGTAEMIEFVLEHSNEGCVFSALREARQLYVASHPILDKLRSRLAPGVEVCDIYRHRRRERGQGCCDSN